MKIHAELTRDRDNRPFVNSLEIEKVSEVSADCYTASLRAIAALLIQISDKADAQAATKKDADEDEDE